MFENLPIEEIPRNVSKACSYRIRVVDGADRVASPVWIAVTGASFTAVVEERNEDTGFCRLCVLGTLTLQLRTTGILLFNFR